MKRDQLKLFTANVAQKESLRNLSFYWNNIASAWWNEKFFYHKINELYFLLMILLFANKFSILISESYEYWLCLRRNSNKIPKCQEMNNLFVGVLLWWNEVKDQKRIREIMTLMYCILLSQNIYKCCKSYKNTLSTLYPTIANFTANQWSIFL